MERPRPNPEEEAMRPWTLACVLVSLLWSVEEAYAGEHNFKAMHEACAGSGISSQALCEDAVGWARYQYPIFKDAAAEHWANPNKETERRMTQQSNILGDFYAKIRDKFPPAWGARLKPKT